MHGSTTPDIARAVKRKRSGAGRIKVGRCETSASEQKGVMQWTGTMLTVEMSLVFNNCFRLRSGFDSLRACDVVCPLDTAAVTELWRLDLFSCTSTSFLCAGTLSPRRKCCNFLQEV